MPSLKGKTLTKYSLQSYGIFAICAKIFLKILNSSLKINKRLKFSAFLRVECGARCK